MKILNKAKAKKASLVKLNKVKSFIEKLIRKKDLLVSFNNTQEIAVDRKNDLSNEISSNRMYLTITEEQAKNCIKAVENANALQLSQNDNIALLVCNKTFYDFDGNIFYCLDEIGHDKECGYYTGTTLLDKLQKRLESLNKGLYDYRPEKNTSFSRDSKDGLFYWSDPEIAVSNIDNQKWKDCYTKLHSIVTAKQLQIEKLKTSLEETINNVTSFESRIVELEKDNDNLKNEISLLENNQGLSRIEELKKINHDLTNTLSEVESVRDSLLKSNDYCRTRLEIGEKY